jgi:hypothetical protein
MGFPKIETVKAFIHTCDKDGFESIVDKLLNNDLKNEYKPLFAYLKKIVTDMLADDLVEECNYYTSGFVSCFDLFRRQIESEDMDVDDIQSQLKNLLAWSSFLEDENVSLKNKITLLETSSNGIERNNTELPKVPTVQ